MYGIISELFLENRIDSTGLDKAISKKWITEEEKVKIIASKVTSA